MAELEVQIDGRGARTGGEVVVRALNRIRQATRRATRETDRNARTNRRAKREAVGLGRAIGALGGLLVVRQVIAYADAWTQVQNRLRLVTDSQEELNAVSEEVFAIAQRNRTGLEGTAELYARVARSSEELGLSQQEVLDVTDSVSKAITISGVSAEAANAAIVQLGQGLASGALRGDELRSVLEQTPRLARAIADGLDVPIGKLRELGAEGELTSEKVIAALQSQADVLEEEFGQIGPTIGQGFTTLINSVTRFIGRFGEATGLFDSAAETLIILSGAIDEVGDGFFDATFEVAQFVRALAGGLATLDERFRLFQNTVVGVLATVFGDDAVAEQAAADRIRLEQELDRQIIVILDALEEERALFEQRREERAAAETFDLTTKVEVEGVDEAEMQLAMLRAEFERLSGIADTLDVSIPALDEEALGDPTKLTEGINKLRESLSQFGEGLTEKVQTPLEEYTAATAQYKTALDANIITQETYNRLVLEAATAYRDGLPAIEEYNDKLERGARITEELRTPTEVYRDTVLDLIDLLNVGAITQETFNRALVQAQEELADAVEENDGFAKFLEQISIQAARNIQSAFADFLFDPFDEGLDGLLRNFGETLRRLAAEALSAQFFKILQDQFASLGSAGGGGGFGGFLSSALSFFGGGFADGGDFSGGRPILVGEEGPEIITPRQSGTVIPNMQMAAPQVNVSPAPVVVVDDPSKVDERLQSAEGSRALVDAIANKRTAINNTLGNRPA